MFSNRIVKKSSSNVVALRTLTGDALATMLMGETAFTVKLLCEVTFVEEILEKLRAYPGALERIIFCDASPRSLKAMAEDALEEAGYVILT